MTCSLGQNVAIIGGGLAGLAAGCALSRAGFRVTVFERKPYLGGRASSYEHAATGEVVDNCQHVLLGCCTNLIDLYQHIGARDLIRWYDSLNFIEPGGRRTIIRNSPLPAPLHTALSFLWAPSLAARDKVCIAKALFSLMKNASVATGSNNSFLQWLRARGQTRQAIDRFWKVVLVSALNEDLDRMSIPAAAMVFRESFLKSRRGGQVGVPCVPLSDLYGKAGDYIRAHGGTIELRAAVQSLEPIARTSPGPDEALWSSRAGVRLCANGEPRMYHYAISAVPFDSLARLLPPTSEAEPLRAQLAQFQTSPITGVHLWFDREVTDLDHAVLLDRTIQWMFHKSRILGRREQGSYIELVISASRVLVEMPRPEIIKLALREFAEFFPEVKKAQLLKSTVVKEIHATMSPLPGSDGYRPAPRTGWPQIFLAGDWTATGWPATMEGAVRSGYLAAEALCRDTGKDCRFLVPDLAASGLMRWQGR
jgi:squalene-associated FAD-dependent desaturase